jgi:hypothetical protein
MRDLRANQPSSDIQIKSGIFLPSLITKEFGKLAFIGHSPNPPPNALFAVPPKRGTKKRRLAWIFKENE